MTHTHGDQFYAEKIQDIYEQKGDYEDINDNIQSNQKNDDMNGLKKLDAE